MIDLAAALRAVVSALDSLEIDYVVVGSTAAAAWGSARLGVADDLSQPLSGLGRIDGA